ncbi:hypothetical protein [Burkholderia sp. SCN-KJ]|uniref:hypothetical protein n=1 Tax=Burkholderia sp. SCN-KJ TaxID=2969248 RepID=UPI00214FF922|nr:hypothetical protein [Burkholderia sp. SCN-KJ]MCR4466793.1 hypothetical protein [Burkholderia sp. SCN-KJ]
MLREIRRASSARGTAGDDDADQFSAACEYDVSKRMMVHASAAWLHNRGQAAYTPGGVNVTGLTPSWPGVSVRGFQFGVIDRFQDERAADVAIDAMRPFR